jgi:hypothetical protein
MAVEHSRSDPQHRQIFIDHFEALFAPELATDAERTALLYVLESLARKPTNAWGSLHKGLSRPYPAEVAGHARDAQGPLRMRSANVFSPR